MQQQPPTSRMDHQGIIQNPEGLWCYRPHTLLRCPRKVLYQPQQAMVLQVPRVIARALIAPLLIQDQNLFADRPNQLVENTIINDHEALDLEVRL
ncbi:hypothetical protein H5410_004110 [Solanum commersonii]|uniref:Uncharacterized protein n=1 Tax=Solanum commersonii TaxID=4109 RepID=A0A9J6B6U2_SOLCO|nr:hypothetical protein H5410_004110 [Solanum commersonii]